MAQNVVTAWAVHPQAGIQLAVENKETGARLRLRRVAKGDFFADPSCGINYEAEEAAKKHMRRTTASAAELEPRAVVGCAVDSGNDKTFP